MDDVLVIGSGPAGLAIAAALCASGLRVQGLTLTGLPAIWLNTYGIWSEDLEPLGMVQLLSHRWTDCTVYAGGREIPLPRTYGLFDNAKLQAHLLAQCERGGMAWQIGAAGRIEHFPTHSTVITQQGVELSARLVIDASGHIPAFINRPKTSRTSFQAAYGIIGTFSSPPVRERQMVLMDYRADYLPLSKRQEPPTFLYAMDLGGGTYFVEETSLAYNPALSFDSLEDRLYRRLAWMGVKLIEIQHIERCLFPMDLPLPNLRQRVMGYGGAASMVHPATGYQVGAALRRAAEVAQAIAKEFGKTYGTPGKVARAAWQTLWPIERVRRRNLYLFGLENLMRLDYTQINGFFYTFFGLPFPEWTGYLSDNLSTRGLLWTMLRLFYRAPGEVRRALAGSIRHQTPLLWKVLWG